MLAILGKIQITKKQMLLLGGVFSILAVTFLLSYAFNDYWFSTRRATLSSVKLIFYSVSLVVYYNFISQNRLKQLFLRINNVLAVTTVIIGLAITLLIYLDQFELPNLIWTFTRQDTRSFYFAGNDAVVRTRSMFSEPAHMGYYLNSVFFSNLFYKKAEAKKSVLFILVLGIIVTYSYSMILVFLLTLSFWLFNRVMKGEFSWSYWYLAALFFFRSIDRVLLGVHRHHHHRADEKHFKRGRRFWPNIRLLGSWMYVESERLIYGNGIGHTPPVTNIYAYVLSDFGLLGFIPYLGLTGYVFLNSLPVAVMFIMMNMSKGGYLNPAFWLFLLFTFLYGVHTTKKSNES
ncbi:MAG: hypothetical protein U5K84_06590 [Alkalibacterium sp.]|nr:hypothetical protein [Alkalibacterium sp.]